MKDKCIILTGGGTAGHVTLNINLEDELYKDFEKVVYIGSHNGIEKELIKKIGLATAEIEGVEEFGENLDTVVVAKILEVEIDDLMKLREKFYNLKIDNSQTKLNDLNLEFADIEECEVVCLNDENISDFDSFTFNKMLKDAKIYIFSKLTGKRII